MARISKEQEKAIINKAVELAYDGVSSVEAQKRLCDYSTGLFSEDVPFLDVYICIKRAILTVQGVLEELKEENYVEHENSVQEKGCSDRGELVKHDHGFTTEEITRLP